MKEKVDRSHLKFTFDEPGEAKEIEPEFHPASDKFKFAQ
jgi:hypothetical protein